MSVMMAVMIAKQSTSPFSVQMEPCNESWPMDYEQIYHVSKHLTANGRRSSSGLLHHHGNKRDCVLRWWIQRCKRPSLLGHHMESCPSSQLLCCLLHKKVKTLNCAVCGSQEGLKVHPCAEQNCSTEAHFSSKYPTKFTQAAQWHVLKCPSSQMQTALFVFAQVILYFPYLEESIKGCMLFVKEGLFF